MHLPCPRRPRRGFFTLLLSLPLLAGLTSEVQAQAVVECTSANDDGSYTVPSNWPLRPSGLGGGSKKFRLLFMTSTRRTAQATDIATYNTFVQNRAKAGHSAISDSCGDLFKVFGSTSAVHARFNTRTRSTDTAAPIYWLNGPRVADDYGDFYDGSWDSNVSNSVNGTIRDESGSINSNYDDSTVFSTGSLANGTRSSVGFWLGSNVVLVGRGSSLHNTSALANNPSPFYAISPVFFVELPSEVTLSVSGNGAAVEGGSDLTITAMLSETNKSGAALTIPIGVKTSATTASGSDYTVASSITIAANAESGATSFTVTDDNVDEPPETVVVELGTLPSGTVAGTTDEVTFTITDNDATVVSILATEDVTFTEEIPTDTAEITVRLSRQLYAGEQLAVPVELGLFSGLETHYETRPSYALSASGNGVTVTDVLGDTFDVNFTGDDAKIVQEATIIVTPTNNDDGNMEDGYVDFILSFASSGEWNNAFTNVGGGGMRHDEDNRVRAVYQDNEVPVVSISGGAAVEGNDARFTLTAEPAPLSSISVAVQVTDSGDFADPDQTGARTVTVGTSGTATLTVSTDDDNADEPNGSISATVQAGTGYRPHDMSASASVTITVTDNDPTIVSILATEDVTFAEEIPTDTAEITVRLARQLYAGEQLAVPVELGLFSGLETHYETRPSYALSASGNGVTVTDVLGDTFDVNFTGDDTNIVQEATIIVTPTDNDDGNMEDGYVDFILSFASSGEWNNAFTNVGGGGMRHDEDNTVRVIYRDNDVPDDMPVVSISGGEAVTEGGDARFTLTAEPAPLSSISVTVQVTDSGDFADPDQIGARTVTVGTSGTATLTVSTDNDNVDEPNGLISATVQAGTGYRPHDMSASTSVTITVTDNDPTIVSILATEDVTFAEETSTDTAEITVRLSRQLYAGEQLAVPVELGLFSGLETHYETRPSYALSASGNGVTVTDVSSDTFEVNFTGDDTNIVQEATIIVTPTNNDDGNMEDGYVNFILSFASSGEWNNAFTNVGGGGMRHDEDNTVRVIYRDNDVPDDMPVVSISGGEAVTEGGDARFTLTAEPAPLSSISVTVQVTDSGDFADPGQTGARTVTVGTSGTATLTVSTDNDNVDEPNGLIRATVQAGTGYRPHDMSASASVAITITDNDPTIVSMLALMTSDLIITEQAPTDTAEIPVRLSRRLYAGEQLAVPVELGLFSGLETHYETRPSYALSASGNGVTVTDVSSDTFEVNFTGDDTNIVQEATIIVTPTNNDDGNMEDGYVNFILSFASSGEWNNAFTNVSGGGMRHNRDNTVRVIYRDNDMPVVSISGGAAVTEGGNATFTLTAEPAPLSSISVTVQVTDSGDFADPGQTGARTVTVGTSGTATLTVSTDNDNVDEPNGLIRATVQAGTGYRPHDMSASASVAITITDNDPTIVSMLALMTSDLIITEQAPTDTAEIPVRLSRRLYAGEQLAVPVELGLFSGLETHYETRPSYALSTSGNGVTVTDVLGDTFEVNFTGDDANIVQEATIIVTPTDNDDGNMEDGYVNFVLSFASGGEWNNAFTNVSGGGMRHNRDNTVRVIYRDNDMPVVSISGGAAVTEGGNATFTLTAEPAPQSNISVTVQVTDSGDFADPDADSRQTGARTVTVDTSGTAILTISTDDDNVDEPDGLISATVQAGTGYRPHDTSASASVTINDNDTISSVPVVTITPVTSAVTEGDPARFTVEARPAPTLPLTVNLTVSQSGDFAEDGETGMRTVTIPTAGGTATYTVDTVDDQVGENDGSVTVSITASTANPADYTLGSTASATVQVNDDNDVPGLNLVPSSPMMTAGDSSSIPSLTVPRGGDSPYDIVLVTQPSETVMVSISVPQGSGLTVDTDHETVGNQDTLTFRPDTWDEHQTVTVTAAQDAAQDSTLIHTVTVDNDGKVLTKKMNVMVATAIVPEEMQRWHVRLGRTISQQVVDALQDRFAAPPPPPGLHLTVAGEVLTGALPLEENRQVLSKALGFESLTAQQVVEGSAFSFSPEAEDPGLVGAQFALWGQGVLSSFRGEQDGITLDGEVPTALLGAEWRAERWQAGAALSHSWGNGSHEGDNSAEVDISSSMTGLFPYGRYGLTPRLGIWAAAGWGWGSLSLQDDGRDVEYTPDASLSMTAVGMDGLLIDGGAEGLSLITTVEALTVRTTSEAVDGLAGSEGVISRRRLGLEATRAFQVANGASLTPSLNVGIREDGGDAETGFGMELGAGLLWADPARGIRGEVKGRTLLTHAEEEFREHGLSLSFAMDPTPSNRGPSFSVSHGMGSMAAGGVDALLNSTVMQVLDADTYPWQQQFEAQLTYGVLTFADRLTLTPGLGLALSSDSTVYNLFWSLAPYAERAQAEPWEVSLEGERQQSSSATSAEHSLGLRFSLLF